MDHLPIYLKVPRAIELSDHDYERKKQEKLLLLSRRVLALPVGRGMLTIGNLIGSGARANLRLGPRVQICGFFCL